MSAARKKSFYTVEVAGLVELGRLACALERIPLPIIHVESAGGVLGVQFNTLDRLLVLYYTRASQSGHFLAYRNIEGREEVQTVDRMDNPTFLYAPIIFTAEPPPGFSIRTIKPPRKVSYSPVRLRDQASLAKLSAYQMLYNETVLPLFSFPSRNEWVLGLMITPEESDSGYFYYVSLERAPNEGFLRYDMHGGSVTAFTNRMTEHGFLFFKIIRLKDKHPLVFLR